MAQNKMVVRNDVDILTLGNLLSQSGFFADTRDAAQAVVKVFPYLNPPILKSGNKNKHYPANPPKALAKWDEVFGNGTRFMRSVGITAVLRGKKLSPKQIAAARRIMSENPEVVAQI